jgi:hypothetical protein
VLPQMKRQAWRAEQLFTDIALFSVGLACLNPAVGAFPSGYPCAWRAWRICQIANSNYFTAVHPPSTTLFPGNVHRLRSSVRQRPDLTMHARTRQRRPLAGCVRDRICELCQNGGRLHTRPHWALPNPEPGHTAGCAGLRCAISHDPVAGRLAAGSSSHTGDTGW